MRFHLLMQAAARRLDFTGSKRARADEAHVASKDVPELRQLVHRSGAQHAADARDTRVVLRRLHGANSGFGVWNHRSELERAKNAAAFADPSLPVEDRPAVSTLTAAAINPHRGAEATSPAAESAMSSARLARGIGRT